MLVFEGCIGARAMMFWVAYTATWDNGGIQVQVLPRNMSRSVPLLQLGSAMVSVAPVISGGHRGQF